MNPAAKVKLAHVEHVFPGSGLVLRDFNLSVAPSEFIAVLGPSGSGKSTLLRLIAGLLEPSKGSVDVESFGQKFFRSFVFQEAHLLPWRTVLQNTVLPLEIMGVEESRSLDRARSVLAQVGLAEAVNLYPSELSGGMRMRVSLARALVGEPSLLLMDEPFSALDETTRYLLQEDLRELWRKLKTTIVFVTHSISEAVFLADRLVILSAKPSTIVLDKKLGLPEERLAPLRRDPIYLGYTDEISRFFRSLQGRVET
jgi:NitT/TauT family transport system ATP-binding protein